jgi:magnesium transporter
MVPNLVASFYGMNVDLPLQNDPIAFVIIFVFSIGVSITVAWYFMRKKWF